MASSKAGVGANRKKKFTCSKWHWKPEADKLLTKLVQRFGPSNWELIANHFQGRSGKSCRLRWVNQLNPQVDKKPFSVDERQRLLELHRSYGNKWSMISKFFPGLTDNQLKNQYHVLMGTRSIKASISSSSINHPNISKQGSEIAHQFGSDSTMAFASHFSSVSCYRSHSNGSILCLSSMPDKEKMPACSSGGSFVNGRNWTWFAAHCSELSKLPYSSGSVNNENIYFNQKAIQEDSLISDAKSADVSLLCPVAQPQQGGYVKGCQFIDFFWGWKTRIN